MKKKLLRFAQKVNKLYFKNFFLLLAVAAILLMGAASALYMNFEKISQQAVFQNSMDSLRQTDRDAALLVETGQNLALQIYSDNSLRGLLHHDSVSEHEKAVGLEQLANYQYMGFIDSIYLYNKKSKSLYLSQAFGMYHNRIVPENDFFDKEALDWIHSPEKRNAYVPIPRNLVLQNGQSHSVYSFLGYDYIDKTTDGELLCAVVINISTKWIETVMELPAHDKTVPVGETFLLSADGQVISNSKNYSMMENISSEPYIRRILEEKGNGYFVTEISGEKTFVAYTAPDKQAWRYLRVIPYCLIVKDIDAMRTTTAEIVLIIFLFSTLLLFVVNRIQLQPLQRYKIDVDTMSAQGRKAYYGAKQNFLRTLILENGDESPELLIRQFSGYELPFNVTLPLFAVLIKLDKYAQFAQKNSAKARTALRFAVMNMVGDIYSPAFVSEGADMGMDHLLILFQNKGNAPFDKNDFSLRSRKLQQAAMEHLELSISLFVSTSGTVQNLPELYRQVQETQRGRIFAGSRCLLYADEQLPGQPTEGSLFEKSEKRIADALIHGNFDQAQAAYLEMIRLCKTRDYYEFELIISRLTLSLNQLMAAMRRRLPEEDLSFSPLYIHLDEIEDIQELHQQIFAYMRQISACSSHEKRGGKSEALIASVEEIISMQYTSRDLCIESIAEVLGMSPSYLGRLYRHGTGKTILDQIQLVRMESARNLLVSTDNSVSVIAAKIGYSSDTYFHKIFKQEHALTPLDYRKKERGE